DQQQDSERGRDVATLGLRHQRIERPRLMSREKAPAAGRPAEGRLVSEKTARVRVRVKGRAVKVGRTMAILRTSAARTWMQVQQCDGVVRVGERNLPVTRYGGAVNHLVGVARIDN